MDILALGLFAYALYYSKDNTEINDKEIQKSKNYVIDDYETHYLNNYTVDFLENNFTTLNKQLNTDYKKSLLPNSHIVNDQWRHETYYDPNKKKLINKLLSDDLGTIKNKNYLINNIIEPMNNINNNNNYDNSDSVFSDDYKSFDYKLKNNRVSSLSIQSDDDNINIKTLNTQQKFIDDLASNFTKSDDISMDTKRQNEKSNSCNVNFMHNEQKRCNNQYLDQFDQLKFSHNGLPEGFNNVKPTINIFNKEKPTQRTQQEIFNSKDDGRYGVTSNMTHQNMQPFFSAKSYGYDPGMDKQKAEIFTRNVELFTGSDQNLQFKHKKEVKTLFSPETNRVESLTGVPNFSNFFESRYIPSDKRQNERPFEPIRVTPGLNLGYNQTGSTGRQDLYRALPKTVDQLRTVTNPKVSYGQPVIPGMKGERRGVIGDMIQKTPDRFYYSTPDSMMPNTGPLEAPTIYGKFTFDQTNRAIDENTIHLNPTKGEVEKNTPDYLREGEYTAPFKINYLHDGPRNVEYGTKAQVVSKNSYNNVQTERSIAPENVHLVGTAGNKQNDYLVNYENFTPDTTQRETMPEKPNANIKGNYTSVPLINFLNYIPETTLKDIILEDNGRKNLTNVSNSLKGYLFNSINSIKDPTLRNLIEDKIKIVNQQGNHQNNYLFNNKNAIPDQTLRNCSENNVIITTISNSEKGYLFNNLNAIPDPTLRQLVNTLWGTGGLNYNGNYKTNQMFNYKNAIPDTTLKELTENLINLTNVTGPSGQIKGYLLNYINAIPEQTLRNLTQDNIVINNISPLLMKNYLINYINSVPDTTLRELTENKKYIIGQKGNYNNNYIFNYENGIPDQTLRSIISDIIQITNIDGNHKTGYLINYINALPDQTLRNIIEDTKNLSNINGNYKNGYMINYTNATPDNNLRQMTEENKNLLNIKPIQMKNYIINYLNSIPDMTLRELTCNTRNITGQKGNRTDGFAFNYDNGIPDINNRVFFENTKNITGQKGNKDNGYSFNYVNGVPDMTIRALTENTKNITGQNNQYTFKEYMFNYDNGVPDTTIREMTSKTKNITGTVGNKEQGRGRMDYSNALLNTEKEVIAEGRDPVPVKDNRGPTPFFTEYVFCNDDNKSINVISGVKPNTSIKNELFFG